MSTRLQSGFTLIELMVTIAILGILVTIAAPSFNDFFDKKRLVKGAEAIYSELQLARSESIARSADIHVEFVTDGGPNWDFGMSETADCTVTELNPATAGACFLVVESGATAGTQAAEDNVLKLVRHDDYAGVNMIAAAFGATNDITFDSVRGTAEAGSIRLESDNGLKLRIDVSILGRVNVCSPTGANHVSGYNSTGCTDW